MGGPRAPLDPPPRGPAAAAAAADRAPGERVSMAGTPHLPRVGTRYLRIAPQAVLGGCGRGQGQGQGQGQGRRCVAPPNFNQERCRCCLRGSRERRRRRELCTSKVKLQPHPTCSLGGESRLGSVLGKTPHTEGGPAHGAPRAVPPVPARDCGRRAGARRALPLLQLLVRSTHRGAPTAGHPLRGTHRGAPMAGRPWRDTHGGTPTAGRPWRGTRGGAPMAGRPWPQRDLSGAARTAPAPAAAALGWGIGLTPGMEQGSCSGPRSWKPVF